MLNFLFPILLCLSIQACSVDPVVEQDNYTYSFYLSAASGFVPDTLDRGIGILTFVDPPGFNPEGKRDTIFVFSEPDSNVEILYLFVFIELGGGYRYGVGATEIMQTNIIEFGYEICGMPFDSLTSSGWARVVLGFNSSKSPHKGWVRLDSSTVRHHLWTSILPSHSLYFIDNPQFHDQPNGTVIDWTVSGPPQLNYIMHPLTIQDSWLYVRVARPADICVGPGEVQSDTLFAWVQYLRNNGRPRVWYYTRGC